MMNVLFEKQINQTVYREIEPHTDLQSTIDCFWTMDTRDNDLLHRVVPNCCINILFEWTVLDARCRSVGPTTRHIEKCYNLTTRILGVRFSIGKAAGFFDQPFYMLTNRAFRIDRLWKDCRHVYSILESTEIGERSLSKLNELLLRNHGAQFGRANE